jgi:hypothetical protein
MSALQTHGASCTLGLIDHCCVILAGLYAARFQGLWQRLEGGQRCINVLSGCERASEVLAGDATGNEQACMNITKAASNLTVI